MTGNLEKILGFKVKVKTRPMASSIMPRNHLF
jgi:hypothetical protein